MQNKMNGFITIQMASTKNGKQKEMIMHFTRQVLSIPIRNPGAVVRIYTGEKTLSR